MAAYEYDEAGVMAAYFLITFLALVLVPFTISAFKKSDKEALSGCQCSACLAHQDALQNESKGSLLNPKISRRTWLLLGGWSLFAFVSYRVSKLKVDSKIYDPFEILGLKSSTAEKEIKSHYKKLSKIYHPDKVKASVNETIDMIQERFVQITKAYKSLTDEKIRENWVKYGNPDGPQSTTMGIALPKWIVEGKNNIWVLGAYGLVFGGALPALVGKWWFGNRQKTKDGVQAQSAAAFFKSVREDSSPDEIVAALAKAFTWEAPVLNKATAELDTLDKTIGAAVGAKWATIKKYVQGHENKLDPVRRQGLIMIYAHFLRLKIEDPALHKQQQEILLQTPLLLNALLNTANSRNWLSTTITIMRLHSYFTQAVNPSAVASNERRRFSQLPGVSSADIDSLENSAKTLPEVVSSLEAKKDSRAADVKKALQKWSTVELVDASFKVIGERIVTPSAIVFLLVKLRISPPGVKQSAKPELSVDETKRVIQQNEQLDEEFLVSKLEAEELPSTAVTTNAAHAPLWPTARKPSWWIVLADDKSNRLVVPPVKITDVPYPQSASDRDYRSYKIQFQCPPNVGMFTWKLYVVSDTFVGEDITREIVLKVEDAPVTEQDPSEDDISDPEEDSLAGQMAAMRGGSVKKRTDSDDDDDESSTDDGGKDDDDSDSDSDSD